MASVTKRLSWNCLVNRIRTSHWRTQYAILKRKKVVNDLLIASYVQLLSPQLLPQAVTVHNKNKCATIVVARRPMELVVEAERSFAQPTTMHVANVPSRDTLKTSAVVVAVKVALQTQARRAKTKTQKTLTLTLSTLAKCDPCSYKLPFFRDR